MSVWRGVLNSVLYCSQRERGFEKKNRKSNFSQWVRLTSSGVSNELLHLRSLNVLYSRYFIFLHFLPYIYCINNMYKTFDGRALSFFFYNTQLASWAQQSAISYTHFAIFKLNISVQYKINVHIHIYISFQKNKKSFF